MDRVGVGGRVEAKGGTLDGLHKEEPHIPLGEDVVHRLELHEPRKPLIQPQVRPPFHRHQIAEPHVRKLVADGARARDFGCQRRVLLVDE